jgi:hypothetical protein
MNESDIYRQADDCLLEDMDGELLLYHPPSAVTLHLNGPSAVVWQLIDGERSIGEIIAVVKEAYPAQADQIAEDVASVMADLSSREVVVKVSG